jgi:hypothetical protein
MMDLRTKKWEDQRGRVWNLPDLVQPHLENIQKLLKDVIDGKREPPEGCHQSIYELKMSLYWITAEVNRRKDAALTQPLPETGTFDIVIPPGSRTVEVTISFRFK